MTGTMVVLVLLRLRLVVLLLLLLLIVVRALVLLILLLRLLLLVCIVRLVAIALRVMPLVGVVSRFGTGIVGSRSVRSSILVGTGGSRKDNHGRGRHLWGERSDSYWGRTNLDNRCKTQVLERRWATMYVYARGACDLQERSLVCCIVSELRWRRDAGVSDWDVVVVVVVGARLAAEQQVTKQRKRRRGRRAKGKGSGRRGRDN